MKRLLLVLSLSILAIQSIGQTSTEVKEPENQEIVDDAIEKAKKKQRTLRIIQISAAVLGGVYYATKK